MVVSGQRHALAPLTLEKEPPVRSVKEAGVGTRAGLDAVVMEKKTYLPLPGIDLLSSST
jgi:hypothetical protein